MFSISGVLSNMVSYSFLRFFHRTHPLMHFSWSSCTTIQSTVSKGKQDQRHPQKIFASAGYHQNTLLQQGSHGLSAETWERRERWDFDPSDSLVGVSDLPAPATSETTWDHRIFGSSWLKIFWRPSGRTEQFESNCHWNWFTSVFLGYFFEGRTIEKKTFQWPKRSLMNESSHLGSAKNLGGWTGWTSSSTSRF